MANTRTSPSLWNPASKNGAYVNERKGLGLLSGGCTQWRVAATCRYRPQDLAPTINEAAYMTLLQMECVPEQLCDRVPASTWARSSSGTSQPTWSVTLWNACDTRFDDIEEHHKIERPSASFVEEPQKPPHHRDHYLRASVPPCARRKRPSLIQLT